MSWSFRRRIKVIPGVYLNLSKKGISTSVGVKGASLTFGSDGVYRNLSLPGTGIYSRQKIGNYESTPFSEGSDQGFFLNEALNEGEPDYSFISADPLEVTSDGLSKYSTYG